QCILKYGVASKYDVKASGNDYEAVGDAADARHACRVDSLVSNACILLRSLHPRTGSMEVEADLRPILGSSLVRLDPMRIKQLQWVLLKNYSIRM
ncbi:unnamed protein product, partial [Strongylus vulgaris]